MLIEKGANVNEPDGEGFLPVHIAAASNNGLGVEYLITLGKADVNCLTVEEGDSPLRLAMSKNAADAIRVLCKHGADPFKENKEGNSASSLFFKEKTKHTGSHVVVYDSTSTKIEESTKSAVLEGFGIVDPREFLTMKDFPQRVSLTAHKVSHIFKMDTSQFAIRADKDCKCRVLAHVADSVGVQNEKVGAVLCKWTDNVEPVYKEPTTIRSVVGFTSEAALAVDLEANTFYVVHAFTKYKDVAELAQVIFHFEQDVNVEVRELKDWPHTVKVKSAWKGDSAGGAQPLETWLNNPNFLLKVPQQKDLDLCIMLSQQKINTDGNFLVQPYTSFIGFYIYQNNLEDAINNSNKFLNSRDVFCTFKHDGTALSEMVVIPATHKDKIEKSFTIQVFSSSEINFEPK